MDPSLRQQLPMSMLIFEEGHCDRVEAISFSADSSKFATSCRDHNVRLWDSKGRLLGVPLLGPYRATFAGNALVVHHEGYIARMDGDRQVWRQKCAAYALHGLPTGEVLASEWGETLWRFSAEGERLVEIDLPEHADHIEAQPDGNLIAAWSRDAISIVQGEKVRKYAKKKWDIHAVALHPTDPRIAILEDHWNGAELTLINANGKRLTKMDVYESMRKGRGSLSGAVFLPDGRLLVLCLSKNAELWVVDVEAEKILGTCALVPPSAFALSPDAKHLAVGTNEGDVSLWSLEWLGDLTVVSIYATAGVDAANTVAYDANRRTLHAARGAAAEVWTNKGLTWYGRGDRTAYVLAPRPGTDDVMIGKESPSARLELRGSKSSLKFKGITGVIECIVFHPQGDRVALGRCIFDMKGKIIKKDAVDYFVAGFSDGEGLLTADHDTSLRIVEWTGEELMQIPLPQLGDRERIRVEAIATSPVGATFACALDDVGVFLWQDPAAQPQALQGTTGATVITFSPEGGRIATGDYDGIARVYDAKTGQVIRTANIFGTGRGARLAFVKPTVLALCAMGGEIRLWNIEDCRWLALRAVSAKEWLAVSSDGRFEGTSKLIAKLFRVADDGSTVEVGSPTKDLVAEWLG